MMMMMTGTKYAPCNDLHAPLFRGDLKSLRGGTVHGPLKLTGTVRKCQFDLEVSFSSMFWYRRQIASSATSTLAVMSMDRAQFAASHLA
jgi:hypothetical protein